VRRAAIVLVGWGLLLAAMTALQAPFASVKGPFGLHPIEYVMLGSASAACLITGLVVWALDVRAGTHESPRVIADGSFATAALVFGLALALVGAGFGLWLILIGAGITALGVGGLVREGRARRHAQRSAQR
jgi:hypothetical protein